MKTLSDVQFELLSLLATAEINKYSNDKIESIQRCCIIAGVSDELIYSVHINRIFSGLKNMDRISIVEYFS